MFFISSAIVLGLLVQIEQPTPTIMSAPITSGDFSMPEPPERGAMLRAVGDSFSPVFAPEDIEVLSVGVERVTTQSDPVAPNSLIGDAVLYHHYFIVSEFGSVGFLPVFRVALVDYQQHHMIPLAAGAPDKPPT